jgi:hypothetical protein
VLLLYYKEGREKMSKITMSIRIPPDEKKVAEYYSNLLQITLSEYVLGGIKIRNDIEMRTYNQKCQNVWIEYAIKERGYSVDTLIEVLDLMSYEEFVSPIKMPESCTAIFEHYRAKVETK